MDEKSKTVRISPTSQLVVGFCFVFLSMLAPVSKIGANCDQNAGRTDSENYRDTFMHERTRVDG